MRRSCCFVPVLWSAVSITAFLLFCVVVTPFSNWSSFGGVSKYFFVGAFVPRTSQPQPHLPVSVSSSRLQAKRASKTTTAQSSFGRKRFCYERLQMKCPDEIYLSETPSIQIATDLFSALSEKKAGESTKTTATPMILPEEMYIAVLDAYMVAYRDTRHKKSDKPTRRDTQEYTIGMDAVVDGMIATVSMMHEHDRDSFDDSTVVVVAAARTVDPYATILHMLLELTLNVRSSHWATRSIEVLAMLESDSRVVVASHPSFANARLVQYNKVLKGLVGGGNSQSSADSTMTLEAVRLLDFLCGNNPTQEVAERAKSPVTTVMDNLLALLVMAPPSIQIQPDAKSFATLLASPLLPTDDAKRLIRASISLGVYEGYLEKFLKRNLFVGDKGEQFSEFL